ncbi:uncharacterized protein LOC142768443 isoform X2 [Rhipicephalus microplus]|uniref:uncharacterized protein LOC142768443 isoform X2 n=1 Tax=Rhipicephalus microplus TaxID=6941 RepID=UPI003F6B1040
MACRNNTFVMNLVFLAIICSCIWQIIPAAGNGAGEARIGADQNVSVIVKVMYTSNFTTHFHQVTGNEKNETDIKQHFKKIFQKVEDKFRNFSIPLNITVKNVSLMDNLTIYNHTKKLTIDSEKTLEKVKEYWNDTKAEKNEAYFLFVRDAFLEEEPVNTSAPTGVVATNGTLCSKDASAAVVRDMFPQNDTYYNRTARGLASMRCKTPTAEESAGANASAVPEDDSSTTECTTSRQPS